MFICAHGADQPFIFVTPFVEDIMKARLKTVGVEEYHFVMENGPFYFAVISFLLADPASSSRR